jgi:ornithine carbamoyltransferase
MTESFAGKSLLSAADLSREQILHLFSLASAQKKADNLALSSRPTGTTLALLFDKSSLRTRVSFEVAIAQLGGSAVYLAPADVRLGDRESVADVARTLGRMVDAIAARLGPHETVVELSRWAGVPVINAQTDAEHPCQALADLFTLQEKKGALAGLKLAYIGDGFNVCHSLLLACAILGVNISIASPGGYEPQLDFLCRGRELAAKSGATVELLTQPAEAVKGADAVYTDVWVSAGLEAEAQERRKAFTPYQVNADLLRQARPGAIVMHCLPARRGEEITPEVIDGPQSVVFDEAENKLHVLRALLSLVLQHS